MPLLQVICCYISDLCNAIVNVKWWPSRPARRNCGSANCPIMFPNTFPLSTNTTTTNHHRLALEKQVQVGGNALLESDTTSSLRGVRGFSPLIPKRWLCIRNFMILYDMIWRLRLSTMTFWITVLFYLLLIPSSKLT